MFISHQHQFAQIAVPRTASVSACAALRQSNISHDTDVFCSVPEQASGSLKKSSTALFDRHIAYFVGTLGLPEDILLDRDKPTVTSAVRSDMGYGLQAAMKLADWVKKGILLHHLTPSHLVRLGLLTEQQLADFNVFAFVRDPLERWVSGQFLVRQLGGVNQNSLAHLTNIVRSGSFRGKNPSSLVTPMMRDYFFHDGQQVVTAYHYDDVETVVGDLIESSGGTRPSEFPQVGVINVVPQEFRAPIADWLPADCVNALQEYFADDIAFYNSVTAE